jgi:hypothetical protein
MVKTYLKYQQEKLFSGSILNKPNQIKLIKCHKRGNLLLSSAHETLIITKSGTNAELLRIFPKSGQTSAALTCILPLYMNGDLRVFWEQEISDGEGIDDPMGLFDEPKPLHLQKRSTILTPSIDQR